MLPPVKQELNYLRESLIVLKNHDGVIGLKTGTEIEDMGVPEIQVMREISSDIVPLTVKIGGAEARQDIRSMLSLNVDCILAPMIESIYALTQFIKAATEIQQEYNRPINLAFNLETINATKNLDDIIETSAFSKIDQVTIGRDDLSKSMHLAVDEEEVMKLVKEITKKINNQKKMTSLGGGLSLQNIKKIANEVDTTYLNTRHVIFKNNTTFKKKPENILFKILDWERNLYSFFIKFFPEREIYYKKRITVLTERCQSLTIYKNQRMELL